jgi:hypothetical protein
MFLVFDITLQYPPNYCGGDIDAIFEPISVQYVNKILVVICMV